MKNRKWLRLLAALLTLVILLSGCTAEKRPRDEEDDRDEREEEMEESREEPRDERGLGEICQAFFEAYAAADGEAVGALLTGMGGVYSYGELTALLAQRITVEIGDETLEEDYGTVSVEITNVDMAAVLAQVPENISSTDEAQLWLAQELAAEDVPMKTYPVQVYLLMENGGWKVELTTELADALLGGYFTVMRQAVEEATE